MRCLFDHFKTVFLITANVEYSVVMLDVLIATEIWTFWLLVINLTRTKSFIMQQEVTTLLKLIKVLNRKHLQEVKFVIIISTQTFKNGIFNVFYIHVHSFGQYYSSKVQNRLTTWSKNFVGSRDVIIAFAFIHQSMREVHDALMYGCCYLHVSSNTWFLRSCNNRCRGPCFIKIVTECVVWPQG